MSNKYLEKIASIIQETQSTSDVTPTQPGQNSFAEHNQSSEDEAHNRELEKTEQAEEAAQVEAENTSAEQCQENTNPGTRDPMRLSDRILRHVAETYGPERDPDHEPEFDPIAFIEQLKATQAINDVERVNSLDPSRVSEGPNGTSSETGISETSTRY
jgi:hypothetical protein